MISPFGGKQDLDLHRFRGLFETENSARKGEQCHEQTRGLPSGVSPRSYPAGVRASDEEHPIPRSARQIGISDGTLLSWVNQDAIDSGQREGLTAEEKEELRRLRREVKTLRQKKEILRKAPRPNQRPGKRSGIGERLQAHRRAEGQLPGGDAMCRMLGVSKSGYYYAWQGRAPSRRTQQDALLIQKIREIHSSRSRETYDGYPRVHAHLRSLGIGCARRRVARG